MSEHKRSKPGGNQPISRHPLFPVIVALWFGALCGAGSIAIPPALIERLVTALGIDHVLPMTAPPLGTTARILMALAMTGLGAVAGIVVARRLTAQEPQVRHCRRNVAPVNAAETGPDEAPASATRRRALAVHAPAAAPDKRILNVAEFALDGFDDAGNDEDGPAVETQELGQQAETFAEDEAPAAFAPSAQAPGDGLFETYARGITARAEDTRQSPFTAAAESHEPERGNRPPPNSEAGNSAAAGTASDAAVSGLDANGAAPTEGRKAAERIATARLEELSPIELLERLALAMAERRERQHRTTVAQAQPTVLLAAETGVEAEPETATAERQPSGPLPFAQPRFKAAPDEVVLEPATDATLAQEPEAVSPAIPAALRPVNFDDLPEDDEDALPAYIPPRHIGLTPTKTAEGNGMDNAASRAAQPVVDDGDEMEDEEGRAPGEGYSSLLDLSRPLVSRENPIQRFISTTGDDDEPEANPAGEEAGEPGSFAPLAPDTEASHAEAPQGERLFDGPGSTGPKATEDALRSALAALQRMSGAA
ncbi:hypothetical protein [Novosphingobium album (ex Hu et al. 2023)]|uniref:Uncharacterized protein n=1 Tax=Novosphingobium album (ex Hu et al. 2023) TaxID=2930093 RepID=A0ABT0B6K4_9SPHN|nr:hypothetical protein [Novosphingobium album (ex Hu et al. 2023)]MCJ2180664.1 hypothetical protein [Novosphingobium album (ex Hu et al. 2023)]